MAGDECAIIDVGGQDTKIILVSRRYGAGLPDE